MTEVIARCGTSVAPERCSLGVCGPRILFCPSCPSRSPVAIRKETRERASERANERARTATRTHGEQLKRALPLDARLYLPRCPTTTLRLAFYLSMLLRLLALSSPLSLSLVPSALPEQ